MGRTGSSPSRRGNPTRCTIAAVAILSLVSPGCAVHSWRPVTDAELRDAAGGSVRVEGKLGAVELAGTTLAHPYLEGRPTGGHGPVYVQVPPGTSAGVRRCAGEPDSGRVVRFAVQDASRLVGCEVQLETAKGRVAIRVRRALGACEVYGEALECRDDRGRVQACTGLVRVDLRQYESVERRVRDAPLTVAATVGALSLVGLAAFYVVGLLAVGHLE